MSVIANDRATAKTLRHEAPAGQRQAVDVLERVASAEEQTE